MHPLPPDKWPAAVDSPIPQPHGQAGAWRPPPDRRAPARPLPQSHSAKLGLGVPIPPDRRAPARPLPQSHSAKLGLGVPTPPDRQAPARPLPRSHSAKLGLGVPSRQHLHQPHPPRQQLLHHPLLDQPRLGQLRLQRLDRGVHVAEDGGDGSLFNLGWGQSQLK